MKSLVQISSLSFIFAASFALSTPASAGGMGYDSTISSPLTTPVKLEIRLSEDMTQRANHLPKKSPQRGSGRSMRSGFSNNGLFGEKGLNRLSEKLQERLMQRLTKQGIQVDDDAAHMLVVITEDAKPNRPTFKQLSSDPGLSFRSFGVGGAEFSGTLIPPEADVSFVTELSEDLSDQNIKKMSVRLCSELHNARVEDTSKIGEKFTQILLKFSNTNPNDIDKDIKLANFWNKYNQKMICSSNSGSYHTQHIFKRAIKLKLHKPVLFDFFLRDQNKFPIDVNTVETYPDGSKATVLDFVNNILNSPTLSAQYNIGQIKRLKSILKHRFKAVSANQ